MKKYYPIILRIGAVVLGGAFFSILQLTQTQSIMDALLIGFIYAVILYIVITVIKNFVISKLTPFTVGQQWLLKTFIYTIAISFSYLTGLLFQTIILTPIDSLKEIISDKIWQGFVALVSSPFRLQVPNDIISAELRGLIIIFFSIFFLIAMVSVVASFIEMRWQEMKQKQAIEKAELTALRAQIEPHFLFNSLNTIVSIIKKDTQKAEDLIIQLSDILNYMFENSGKETVKLESEILFSKNYISLMQARYDNKLIVKWYEDKKTGNHKVPVFVLQPILENIFRHAWHDRNEQLVIEIKVHDSEEHVTVTISDNGIGIRPEILNKIPDPDHALGNISERLFLLFAQKDLIQISSSVGSGTSVMIKIPKGKYD